MRYGNVDLKHPVDADKYKGGHTAPRSPCCGFDLRCDVIPGLDVPECIEDEEARLAKEEARLRYIYKVISYLVWLVSCVLGILSGWNYSPSVPCSGKIGWCKSACLFGKERGCWFDQGRVWPGKREIYCTC